MGSKRVSANELRRVNGTPCHWCKRAMDITSPDLMPSRDHIHPRSQGGRFLVWACLTCNNMKTDMTVAQWQKFMADHPNWWLHLNNKAVRRKAAHYAQGGGNFYPKNP